MRVMRLPAAHNDKLMSGDGHEDEHKQSSSRWEAAMVVDPIARKCRRPDGEEASAASATSEPLESQDRRDTTHTVRSDCARCADPQPPFCLTRVRDIR